MSINETNKFNADKVIDAEMFNDISKFVNTEGVSYIATALANKYNLSSGELLYKLEGLEPDDILISTNIINISKLVEYIDNYGVDIDELSTLYNDFMHKLIQYLFVDATLLTEDFFKLYTYLNSDKEKLFGGRL